MSLSFSRTRNAEYKRSCHEASVRVPTFFSGPGFEGGGRRREVVSLVDLVPTLLDAAGISVPDELPGRSLVPRLKDRKGEWEQEAFIQVSESQVGRAIRTGRWKYGVVAPGKDGGKQKSANLYEETYLYDLKTDPYELQNLITFASHKEVAAHLKDKLLAAMKRAGERQPKIKVKVKRKKSQRVVLASEILE